MVNETLTKPEMDPREAIFNFMRQHYIQGDEINYIILRALQQINTWDLPNDPKELKRLLSDLVDFATKLQTDNQKNK